MTNIFRMQAYDLIMFGYFCIGFINFMFKIKSLTDFRNFFSSHNLEKNEKVILHHFLEKKNINMSKLNLYGTKQIYVQLDNSKSMESKIEKIFNCRNQ